jgi:predicted RNA-binding Zn-ribbon protein involved in translation (DUF1610 family)
MPTTVTTRYRLARRPRARRTAVVHLVGAVIRRNKATGSRDPAVTAQAADRTYHAHAAAFHCPQCGAVAARLTSDFDRPRPNGAVAWVEALGDVTLAGR